MPSFCWLHTLSVQAVTISLPLMLYFANESDVDAAHAAIVGLIRCTHPSPLLHSYIREIFGLVRTLLGSGGGSAWADVAEAALRRSFAAFAPDLDLESALRLDDDDVFWGKSRQVPPRMALVCQMHVLGSSPVFVRRVNGSHGTHDPHTSLHHAHS